MTPRHASAGALRLFSGAPWWLVANGLEEWPARPLERADVAIVGAGVTGALVADTLVREGLSVVLIDRRTPGTGSTAASTALRQYETVVELGERVEMRGERDAVRAWQLCSQAIDRLEEIAAGLDGTCGFLRLPSAYIASRRRHRRRLDQEFELRRRHGFVVERLDGDELEARSGLRGHGALWSAQGAVIDPMALTLGLLRRATDRGAGLLPHTELRDAVHDGDGWRLDTTRGVITAGRLVYATGYEVPPALRDELVNLNSTFALATEPLETLGPWNGCCAAWETARPYTYVRPGPGNRLLAGGADTGFRDAALRDAVMPHRIAKLERRLERTWFPGLDLKTAFSWAGTFGETRDGLPYIGTAPQLDRACVALGYGGNGITFSVVAAGILADLLLGRHNPDAEIFRLDR